MPLNPAAINDPNNLTQLSEKDVMDVLAMACKEFNVDERRTYLPGDSMGDRHDERPEDGL
jgi:predicted peptidase